MQGWEREPWDLMLMDVQMPEMDGPTAARAIRAREAETGRRRTPIIALTANVMSDQVAAYLAAGMDGFVAKPICRSRACSRRSGRTRSRTASPSPLGLRVRLRRDRVPSRGVTARS